MAATHAEWMYGDAASGWIGINKLARLNFLRWSGKLTIAETIAQLQGLSNAHADRPIVLKIPPAMMAPELHFENPADAIAHLQKPVLTCEWMFGDAALGHSVARLNPARWTGQLSLDDAIAQLQGRRAEDRDRPVVIKIPAGVFSPERHCSNVEAAISHIRKVQKRAARAACSWSVAHTSCLCDIGEEARFEGKVQLLDTGEFSSTNEAVDSLNLDGCRLCPEGICVILSKRLQKYVLLYRADRQKDALELFDIEAMTWRDFARSQKKFSLRHFATTAWGHVAVVGDVYATADSFDNSRLVITYAGLLTDHFDVQRELGAGVQGTASLVRRRRTGQEYVAKEAHDADNHSAIRAEFEKLRALRHPNCAKVLELAATKGSDRAAIVCEFARGGDLCSYVSRAKEHGGWTGDLIAGIFKEAMSGVAFLHDNNCVHNDLKPENLLVLTEYKPNEVPRVVITDYGCAIFLNQGEVIQFGDPRYLSPELFRKQLETEADPDSNLELDPANDVWSMGVTLFELVSDGLLPFLYERCSLERFQDEKGLFARVKDVLLGTQMVHIQPHCRLATPHLEQLLLRLLDKNEDGRISAQKVVEELKLSTRKGCTKPVELQVQQDGACQILFNMVIWRLPFDHVKACVDVFEAFDTAHAGRISRRQFKEGLEKWAQDSTCADEVFDMADINGDNFLEFNEFAAMSFDWNSTDAALLELHIGELLCDLSADGTNAVDLADLRRFFGDAIEEDVLQNLFIRIDRDQSAKLSPAAVRTFLHKHKASASPAIPCRVPI